MALRSWNILSLCSGVGMLDWGIHLAVPAARTVGYVERDAFAAAVLVARMEDEALDPAPVWDDLATFDGGRWRGAVDCVAASYPCQPFSSAGKQRGAGDERYLWPEVARVVAECEPEWVFLENVGRHLRIAFDSVWSDLGAMGYDAEAGLFSAAEVGASHGRERLFVLAHAHRDRCNAEAVLRRLSPGGGESDAARGSPSLAAGVGQRREEPPGIAGDAGAQRPAPERDCGHVADAACGRNHRDREARRRRSESQDDGERLGWDCLAGSFPPGREDWDGWARVLQLVPEAEPAFCRVADGLGAGLDRSRYAADRLRCVGNGVVPLVAAQAFLVLHDRLRERLT